MYLDQLLAALWAAKNRSERIIYCPNQFCVTIFLVFFPSSIYTRPLAIDFHSTKNKKKSEMQNQGARTPVNTRGPTTSEIDGYVYQSRMYESSRDLLYTCVTTEPSAVRIFTTVCPCRRPWPSLSNPTSQPISCFEITTSTTPAGAFATRLHDRPMTWQSSTTSSWILLPISNCSQRGPLPTQTF